MVKTSYAKSLRVRGELEKMADMLTVVTVVSTVVGLVTGSIDLAKKLKTAILKARAALQRAAEDIFPVSSLMHCSVLKLSI